MTGGMAKYCIIPRVGDKELPRVGHLTGLLQSPQFLCSYVLMCVLGLGLGVGAWESVGGSGGTWGGGVM